VTHPQQRLKSRSFLFPRHDFDGNAFKSRLPHHSSQIHRGETQPHIGIQLPGRLKRVLG